jgi:prepilin-type processing-associated H-X9-DG protein
LNGGTSAKDFFKSTTDPNPTIAKLQSRVSWAARILPQLERQDLWDRIVNGADFPGDAQSTVISPVDVFVCPADTDLTSVPDNAGLTYVANTGAWDWNNTSGNFDLANFLSGANMGDTKDNGLFMNLTMGTANNRLSNVKDGTGTTLMLSENIHKDTDFSWFGVVGTAGNADGGEGEFGMVWVVPASGTTPTYAYPGSTANEQVRFSYVDPKDTSFPDKGPWYTRPASKHPGGSVNVIFADGHGRAIEPSIDYLVYQQLMTPNGAKCVDPTNWNNVNPPSGPIYLFRTAAPVAEKDIP